MFDHLFENRNTTVTNLLKLGDCLGRSLRENLEIFSIDSENKSVAYLTEKGKVLSGKYTLGPDILLEDIKVRDSDTFTDNNIFDSFVNEKVSYFVGELNSNKYAEANTSFNDILSLWENRLKFENVKKKLEEKAAVFSEDQTIIGTTEFKRFLEVAPQFIDFLSENREFVLKVKEIENAIKLSNSVSKAFNFPKLSYKNLLEDGSYKISRGVEKSVYDLICKQELVKKELLESKKGFEDVWATNAHMGKLASLIFNDDEDIILEALVEAVIDIPYLALTTKKQLFESIENSLSIGDTAAVSTKEVKTFVSNIFEMKKPLKQVVINLLNEKYGINVQNLKETATFEALANTQIVIFESLSRLAPKGSVIKESLSNLGKMLKGKNGVEVIDVNELLQNCFEACEYDIFCNDFTLAEEFSFENILDESVNISELLEKTKERLLLDKKKKKKKGKEDDGDQVPANNDDNLSPEDKKKKKAAQDDEDNDDACHTDHEDDSIRSAESHLTKEEAEGTPEVEENPAAEASPEAGVDPGAEEPEAPISKEDFLETLKSMEELLKGVSPDEDEEDEDEDSEEAPPQTDTEKSED